MIYNISILVKIIHCITVCIMMTVNIKIIHCITVCIMMTVNSVQSFHFVIVVVRAPEQR